MELFVSLPRNEVELARAAVEAGADAIKVHMNVHHAASGTRFGGYAVEHERVREIIAAVHCPVGLMPGADPEQLPEPAELESLAAAGLNFVNIYSHHMPLWFLDLPLRIVPALGHSDTLSRIASHSGSFHFPQDSGNRIAMLEASVFPHEDYGKPFTFADCNLLRILGTGVDVPLAVPTQKHITPEDARWLKRIGIGALIIGAIVTGATADSIGRATAEYKAAIAAG